MPTLPRIPLWAVVLAGAAAACLCVYLAGCGCAGKAHHPSQLEADS